MRIAFIEPHLNCVGGIRRIVETANRLIALGHIVDIFTPPGRPCTWLPCAADVVPLSKLQKYTYDVAVFNLAEQYEWMLKVKAKLRVFWVLAPEAMYKHPIVPQAALCKDFFLIANSKFTVDYIRNIVHYQKDIPIIPGGINPEHFKYVPGIAKEYNVLYYGSARPWKGASLIENSLLGIKGVSVKKMEGLNTPQPQMYELYNKADIYVSANQCEGFSFGQLEAMACGCAVLTTDDGGSRDYIKRGENAMVVDRQVNRIREGIEMLLHTPELRKSLVKAGLKTASEERFDWDKNTLKLESILKNELQK